MKKKVLLCFLQYVFAVVAIILTVIYIYAFESNALPYMDDAYVNLKNGAGDIVGTQEQMPVTDEEPTEAVMTAELFLSGLKEDSSVLHTGVYDSELCGLIKLPVGALGNLSNCSLYLRTGFVLKLDSSNNILGIYETSNGPREVTSILEGAEFAGVRDSAGRQLLVKDGAYYYCENGYLFPAEYDSVNFDKGGMYYPSYVAGNDSGFKAYTENGLWGIKSPDGAVVVPAKYADVYGVEEGVAVGVTKDGGVDIYDTAGNLTFEGRREYTVPTEWKNDLEVAGCFFFKNGLTRVYRKDGESVLINKNGAEFKLPKGFSLVAYTDGVLLLKQSYTGSDGKTKVLYGYMNSDGRWISTPDYLYAHPFYEGLAAVSGADGRWGMIDLNGELVIPMVFDIISDCQDGAILAFDQKQGNCIIGKIEK